MDVNGMDFVCVCFVSGGNNGIKSIKVRSSPRLSPAACLFHVIKAVMPRRHCHGATWERVAANEKRDTTPVPFRISAGHFNKKKKYFL